MLGAERAISVSRVRLGSFVVQAVDRPCRRWPVGLPCDSG